MSRCGTVIRITPTCFTDTAMGGSAKFGQSPSPRHGLTRDLRPAMSPGGLSFSDETLILPLRRWRRTAATGRRAPACRWLRGLERGAGLGGRRPAFRPRAAVEHDTYRRPPAR